MGHARPAAVGNSDSSLSVRLIVCEVLRGSITAWFWYVTWQNDEDVSHNFYVHDDLITANVINVDLHSTDPRRLKHIISHVRTCHVTVTCRNTSRHVSEHVSCQNMSRVGTRHTSQHVTSPLRLGTRHTSQQVTSRHVSEHVTSRQNIPHIMQVKDRHFCIVARLVYCIYLQQMTSGLSNTDPDDWQV